jgi:hypothetical protein
MLPRFSYRLILLLALCAGVAIQPCLAEEALITSAHYPNGEVVPYILNNTNLTPHYIVILFPGGSGDMNIHMQDGKPAYTLKKNFVIRTRHLLVDQEFATVATNSTQSEQRIQALLDDLLRRFPSAQIYLMSTSNGTFDSLKLAAYLADKIAGEIHTSSLDIVSTFDARKYKNRQLLVHHALDGCHATPFSSAQASHQQYGTELLVMNGGKSEGDACKPFAYHGYNGIERETITAIKNWIKQGAPPKP